MVRLGGDEFAAPVSSLEEPSAVAGIASRIRSVIAFPFALQRGTPVQLEGSVDASVYPDEAAGIAELVNPADRSMYRDKWRNKHGDRPIHRPVPGRGVRTFSHRIQRLQE